MSVVDLARLGDAAACVDRPDLPWVADAHLVEVAVRVQMGAVCAGCPVLVSCQDAAVQVGATAAFWAGTHRDATILEPAQDPAQDSAPVLVPVDGVEWLPHRTSPGWEQAALILPAAAASAGDAAAAGDAA